MQVLTFLGSHDDHAAAPPLPEILEPPADPEPEQERVPVKQPEPKHEPIQKPPPSVAEEPVQKPSVVEEPVSLPDVSGTHFTLIPHLSCITRVFLIIF